MSKQYEQRTKKGKGRRRKNLRKNLEDLRQKLLDKLTEVMLK